MNYKRMFDNQSAFDAFKRALGKLAESRRYRFYAVAAKAYLKKQNSEDDNLKTYKLTKKDVEVLFTQYA